MINESPALASGIFCIFVLTMKKYVDVILPLPLPRCFTYSLPDEGAEEVQIGCRVVVPFGRKKYYTAIVRNVHHYAPTEYEVNEISTPLRYCCPVSSGSGNGWPIIIFVRRVMFTKPHCLPA